MREVPRQSTPGLTSYPRYSQPPHSKVEIRNSLPAGMQMREGRIKEAEVLRPLMVGSRREGAGATQNGERGILPKPSKSSPTRLR